MRVQASVAAPGDGPWCGSWPEGWPRIGPPYESSRPRPPCSGDALTLLLGASAAAADPDFGPGNSSKGPNDGGAKCHPPGQTETEPGCK